MLDFIGGFIGDVLRVVAPLLGLFVLAVLLWHGFAALVNVAAIGVNAAAARWNDPARPARATSASGTPWSRLGAGLYNGASRATDGWRQARAGWRQRVEWDRDTHGDGPDRRSWWRRLVDRWRAQPPQTTTNGKPADDDTGGRPADPTTPSKGDTDVTTPTPAVGQPTTHGGGSPQPSRLGPPAGPAAQGGRGGVAAAEFTVHDLLDTAERVSRQLNYAAEQMGTLQMGQPTVAAITTARDQVAAMKRLVLTEHGRMLDAVADSRNVGRTEGYVPR